MNAEFGDNPLINEYEREARLAKSKVLSDRNALSFLFGLNKEKFISKESLETHIEGYDDLIAVLNVVQAGWAKAGRFGIIITDEGTEISGLIFEEATGQASQGAQ